MIWPHKQKDVPDGPHYVILVFSSITIPGDERSRTNPGHGYPEHSKYITEYKVTTNKQEWENEIRSIEGSRYSSQYVAFKVEAIAKIQRQIIIKD